MQTYFLFLSFSCASCRILGTAHVIDVEGKPDAEVACVKLGVELILKHQEVKTVDVLTERLQMN